MENKPMSVNKHSYLISINIDGAELTKKVLNKKIDVDHNITFGKKFRSVVYTTLLARCIKGINDKKATLPLKICIQNNVCSISREERIDLAVQREFLYLLEQNKKANPTRNRNAKSMGICFETQILLGIINKMILHIESNTENAWENATKIEYK